MTAFRDGDGGEGNWLRLQHERHRLTSTASPSCDVIVHGAASMTTRIVLVSRQQSKPPPVDSLTRHQSSRRAKIGRIEPALSSLLNSLVDLIE
jgi:hypothetical protein